MNLSAVQRSSQPAAMNLPRCRLYLLVPDAIEPESAAACLAAGLEAGDVAALLVQHKDDEEMTVRMLEALKPPARVGGVAIVMAGLAELAQRLGVDGVEVSDRPGYEAARSRLGATAIVGADCATSRHLAMEMAEAGADYVGLRNGAAGGLDFIRWWAELFEVPCVALDAVEPAEAGELAGLGADFVRPSPAMWTSPVSAREVVSVTLRALDEAAR